MINDAWNQQTMPIESYVYKIMNVTQIPLWLVDGVSKRPIYIQPLVSPTGQVRGDIPPNIVGTITLVACVLNEQGSGDSWNYQYSKCLANVPINQMKNGTLDSWVCEIREFNMVIFGNEYRANEFIAKYNSYYHYLMKSDFGTRFVNSANYGILNCTGKTLYQVDDSAIEDCGQSDIIEIPSGVDHPLPLWDNQEFNNAYNVRTNVPYIRAYRYSMLNTNNGEYRGVMREHIYEWLPENLNSDGFLYVPYHHMCIFDDKDTAEAFVKTYKTVECYHTIKTVKDVESKLQEKMDKEFADQNKKHKRIIIGAGVLLSLQIAGKIGEVLYNYLKAKKKSSSKGSK